MAIPEQIYVDVDLHKNQLLNPSLHRVTTFPTNPVEGQLCYLSKTLGNKVGKLPYYFDGTAWKVFNGAFSIETTGDVFSVISNTVDGVLLTETVTGLLGKPLGTLSTGYLKYNGTAWVFDNTTTGGTVTSVGLTVPSIFTVSGSPVTTSGNLGFTWNGSVNNFVLGDGTTVSRSTYALASSISGTINKIAKFGTTASIIDSTITDTGSLVTINNALTATGAITFSTFTSAGFVKSNASGLLSIDTTTYLSNDLLNALQDPTGFENLTSSTISFVNATRTFTITPTSSNFNVWIRGIKYVKTTDSVVIPNVAGLHYIYYNSSGVLTSSTTVWDFPTASSVALVYWDGTTSLNLCEERHMTVMDWATHKYLHSTRGTQYVSGFDATYTLNNDNAVGIGLSNGQISDEDIPLSITNGAINGYLTQPINGTSGSFPVYYRVGTNGANGTWRKDTATTLPYKNAGGTAPPNYNFLNGSTWQQSAVQNNYYVAYFIFATNNILEPIISVQGQTSSANLTDAKNNNNPSSLAYADFPAAEAKLLYRIILQTKPSYSGNIFQSQIVEVFDYRNIAISTSIATGGTGTVTSVGLSAPSIFTVSGSPVTNAGVLSFAFNGLSTDFILADGSTLARSTIISKYIGTWVVGASLGTSGATSTTATSITGTGYYIYQITHNLNTLTPNVIVEDSLTGEHLMCPWYTATIATFNQSVPTYTSNNSLVIKLSTDGLTAVLNKTLKIIVTA